MSAPTIFLVDDDPVFLKGLAFQLKHHFGERFSFSEFQSGEACVAALHQNPVLIVLDYYLDSEDPNAMDGLKTLKEIRAKVPNASVIMLSSQGKFGVAAQTIAGGAHHYISKGEDAADELIGMIEKL